MSTFPGSREIRAADAVHYSRAVKTGNWHLAREAEPKDYDLNKNPERNLRESTYKRIGNVMKPMIVSSYSSWLHCGYKPSLSTRLSGLLPPISITWKKVVALPAFKILVNHVEIVTNKWV